MILLNIKIKELSVDVSLIFVSDIMIDIQSSKAKKKCNSILIKPKF